MTEDNLISEVSDAAETIDAFQRLQESILYTVKPVSDGPRPSGSFDPNRYLDVLTHLRLPPDFVLDYYYHGMGDGVDVSGGGEPILYVRHKQDTPLTIHPDSCLNDDDRSAMFGTWSPVRASALLIPDCSEASWFELVLFRIMAPQFYLHWHANYNDFQIVASREQLEKIIEASSRMKPETVAAASNLSLKVLVDFGEPNHVSVTYAGFTKWGGLSRREVRISNHFPYLNIGDSIIRETVNYHCGISL